LTAERRCSSPSRFQTFEFHRTLYKLSFLRIPDQSPGQAQESIPFMTFWIPAFAGMTKKSRFSKLSE
jgi:hypothetical protein